jgi:hypothetical protein
MALLSEIIATLRDLPRRGDGSSDDNNYTDRQLAFIINYYRATLIKRDKDRGRIISGSYVQDLGKVELVKADPHNDCVIGVTGCVLRTKEKVPLTIDTNGEALYTYIGTLEGLSFQRSTFNKTQFSKYSKYAHSFPKWYQIDEYIYIIDPPTPALKYVNIQGVFENPSEANLFKGSCNGEECLDENYFDYEYPLSLTYIDSIYKMYVSVEIKSSTMLPPETTNNTTDDR